MSQEHHATTGEVVEPQNVNTDTPDSLSAELTPFLEAQVPRSCPLDLLAWLERAKAHFSESEGGLTEWGQQVCSQIFDVMVKNNDLISVEIATWIHAVRAGMYRRTVARTT